MGKEKKSKDKDSVSKDSESKVSLFIEFSDKPKFRTEDVGY